MGKPYSLDLRQRVVGHVAAGRSCRAVGRAFGVSASTAVRIVSEHRSRGDVSPKPQGRPAGRFGKLAPHMDLPTEIVRPQPYRNGLCQTQSSPQTHRRTHIRHPNQDTRQHLPSLQT